MSKILTWIVGSLVKTFFLSAENTDEGRKVLKVFGDKIPFREWVLHFLSTIIVTLPCRAEIARLTKVVELKTKEMNRVKRLAKNILDQVLYILCFELHKNIHIIAS